MPEGPDPITLHFESTDGVEVAAHDYGGPGTPTLFVPGTGMAARMWEPVIERLGPDFRAIAVDMRAHGAARGPDDVRFHDHRMVADLSSVIDGFGLSDAWAVGHSMGGATAMLSALARPGSLARLWVYEPIIFPRVTERPEGAFDFVEATKRRRAVYPNRPEVIARYGSRPPLDELHPDCLAAYVEHGFLDQEDGSVRLACDPELESRAFEDYLQDGWSRLPEMTFPVCVVRGGATEDRPGEAAPSIAERLPEGTLVEFANSRHFGCFARLDRVASSLRSWFLGAD